MCVKTTEKDPLHLHYQTDLLVSGADFSAGACV